MSRPYNFKILILGDSGVGKTSLMNRYVNSTFTERYKATIGADFLAKTITIEDKKCNLQIWDTAGNERFHSLGIAFYRGTDACVLVFDLTNSKSFDNIQSWIDEFLLNAIPNTPEKFPFILLGNKYDLVHEDNLAVSERRVRGFCNKRNIKYYAISAKTGLQINESFDYLVKNILDNHVEDDMMYQTIHLTKESEPEQNTSYCYC